jgi:hypothetical protein
MAAFRAEKGKDDKLFCTGLLAFKSTPDSKGM